MATRSRLTSKPNSQGYYTRQIGWERSRNGKLQQHKFLLGTDRKEAERRERKLRELWDAYENSCEQPRPLWPDALMAVAVRIAKGIPNVPVPRHPQEKQHLYAARIQRMQAKYPVISFIPEDQHAYEIGQAALAMFESLPQSNAPIVIQPIQVNELELLNEAKALAEEAGVKFDPILGITPSTSVEEAPRPIDLGVLKPSEPAARSHARMRDEGGVSSPQRPVSVGRSPQTSTLHQALRTYEAYLTREFHRHETGHVSPWGKTQIRQVSTLRAHHSDQFLSQLTSEAVGELIGYWRRRPCKAGSQKPMTAKSASNYLGTLMRFLSWLHTSNEFQWQKPFAFSDYDTRIRRLPSDHARKSLEQVDTFSLDELRLLMKYGRPFERLLLLLSLNCGFGRAEIASLLIGEIYLRRAHSPREQEILGYKTTDADSFIKRIRRKSGVYGEHILFPMTVSAIEWAMERRRRFPEYSSQACLLVTESGTPLDVQTAGSNANQIIPNLFSRLIQRVGKAGHEIQSLSFGKLRKTGSDLVKRHSNGEIAGVFDCHGEPVKSDSLSDAYTNRPFGKVFQAIRDVENFLAPVFLEAGPNPFGELTLDDSHGA